MCQMLLILGAVPDAVTKRQETPLLLATHSNDRNMYRLYFCPRNDESASLNTVRVLVEQGQNDPMQSDDIGETSIFTASRNHSPESWIWLMNQDEYEVDLNYATPGGMTAAALIAQREDLSATLFEPLLRHGIVVDAPCTKMWHFQYGYWFLRFHGLLAFNTEIDCR
jgi:ankyrin repeat protein